MLIQAGQKTYIVLGNSSGCCCFFYEVYYRIISFFLSLLHGYHFFQVVLQMALFALPLWYKQPLRSLFMRIRHLCSSGQALSFADLTPNLERATARWWLQLSLLFKLSSFPWDGANIQTVLQLVNWADFVGLDSNMRSCLNRLYLILFFSVLLLSCHQ